MAYEWTASDFGLDSCDVNALRVADAAESAAVIRSVLADSPGAARRIVVANAAAALVAADRVTTLLEGVKLADATIHSGQAGRVLEQLRAVPVDGES